MRKNKKYLEKAAAVILAAAMLASGCGKAAGTGEKPTVQESGATAEESSQAAVHTARNSGSQEELVAALRAKYNLGVLNYNDKSISINRNEPVELTLEYDPYEEGAAELAESFVVYQDSELKHPLEASYSWDEESGMLTIAPPVYGPAEVDSIEIDLSHLSGTFLGTDEEPGWGNLSQLYLAANVDTKTGDPINGNPLVTVMKINAELSQAPQVKFSQDENGSARFTWKEVPGADEYLLFSINNYDGALEKYMNVLASTADTEWIAPQSMSYDGTETVTMNEFFSQYLISEDYRGEVDEAYLLESDYQPYFGVIAVSADGSSHISNLYNGRDLAHMLPSSIAYNTNEETMGSLFVGTESLPATMGIIMCDGTVSQRVIEYDVQSIEKNEVLPYYTIEGRAYGTSFVNSFQVNDPAWDTLDQDIKAIEERQEKLKNKAGNVETDISFLEGEEKKEEKAETESASEDETTEEETSSEVEAAEEETSSEADTTEEKTSSEVDTTEEETSSEADTTEEPTSTEEETEATPETSSPEAKKDRETADGISADEKITANSALSEYLAIQMLNTEQEIDISLFPESSDTALVVDAFLEAQYQNPLILGIKEAGMDTANSILYVTYDYDSDTTEAKRKEIKEKAAQITDEIITDTMTDLEKELAINKYLCDNAKYDDDALENAAEHDFKYVDDSYNDSFTAYGVLVNGVGVCASYSAGFKLLADEAGLDSIVVTGYLEGNLPHAWNKVKLDGQWNIVDSTNNDNDIIQNALLNLSDDAAYATLTSDDRFVLDSNLYDYEAPSDDMEYYHITDSYFPEDEIRDILAARLQSGERALLRTDYTLDDDAFKAIAEETAQQTQLRLTGFHWMGVIYLEQR